MSTAHGLTPKQKRAARRKTLAFALSEARARVGISFNALARMTGNTGSLVRKAFDDEDPHQVQAADLPAMGEVGLAALRFLAGEMGFELVAKKPAGVVDIHEHLARHSAESTDVVTKAMRALADGRIDADEAAELVRECLEAEGATSALRRRLEAMLAERRGA